MFRHRGNHLVQGKALGTIHVHYRVYKLNSAGRIVSGEWIEADSERQAIDRAETLCGDGVPQIELWQGARRVAILPCAGVEAA